MHKEKNYIIVKDRYPRISEVKNDCVNLCVPTCNGESLASILQKLCSKITNNYNTLINLIETTAPVYALEAGDNITVTGVGSVGDPWIVSTEAYDIQAGDNIDITGTGSTADPWIVSATLGGANNGLSMSGSNAVLGQDVGDAGSPATLLNSREIPMGTFNLNLLNGKLIVNSSSAYDAGTFPLQVVGRTFISSTSVANMHAAGDSEVFGAPVITKVQRDDGILIYERKVVNVAGTTTAGTGVYHISIDSSAGMPATISAAGLGTTISMFTALFQQTTQGVNLNVGIAGPTVSGRTYNNWFAVVNRSNPFFGSPTVPFFVNRIPTYIVPATSVSSVLSAAIAGAYTFGVDCDSKPISLRSLPVVTTGTHILIEDNAGNINRITVANLRTLMGL